MSFPVRSMLIRMMSSIQLLALTVCGATISGTVTDARRKIKGTGGGGFTMLLLGVCVATCKLLKSMDVVRISALITALSAFPASGQSTASKEYIYLGSRVVAIETAGVAAGDPRATLNSPASGAPLTSRTITFGWTAAVAAEVLELKIGKTPGASDIFLKSDIAGSAVSHTVTDIPCAAEGYATVHVQLRSKIGGNWLAATESNYPAPTPALCSGDTLGALKTPAAGSSLGATTVLFEWYPGSSAQKYWLDVGTSQGVGNIWPNGQFGELTVPQKEVSGIFCSPSAAIIWVRLWTMVGGAWQTPRDYQMTPPPAEACSTEVRAVLTSPTPPGPLTTNTQTFTWSTGTGAQKYWLDVGTIQGSGNISNGEQTTTSRQVAGLPCINTESTIWVRLWTMIGGTWRTPYDYSFTPPATAQCGDGRAKLLNPNPNLTPRAKLSVSQSFSWNDAFGAAPIRYWLDVGTGVGLGDIHPAGPDGWLTVTQKTVSNIPCKSPQISTIYVRLWTSFNSVNQTPFDYTFDPPDGPECTAVTTIDPTLSKLTRGQSQAFTVKIGGLTPAQANRPVTFRLGTLSGTTFTPFAGGVVTKGAISNAGVYQAPGIGQTLEPGPVWVEAAFGGSTPIPAPVYALVELSDFYPQDCAYRISTSSASNNGHSAEFLLWQQSMSCASSTQFRPPVQMLLSNSPRNVANPNLQNQCYLVYYPGQSQMLQLWDDSISEPARPQSWTPIKANVSNLNAILVEGKGMTANSQCLVDYAHAWERMSGSAPFMTWNVPLYFHPSFAGIKEVRVRESAVATPWIEVSPWTVPNPPDRTAPSGAITYPAENASVSGTILIQGWALDNILRSETAIYRVKVYADGHFQGDAALNKASTACNTYPLRHGCPNVGFDYSMNVSSLGAGAHVLEFVVFDSDTDGQKVAVVRRQINVTQ